MSKVNFLLLCLILAVLASCGTVKETPKPTEQEEPKPVVVADEDASSGKVVLPLQKMQISSDYRMVQVKGGTFMMESTDGQQKEIKVKDFYIGETEVTQALWSEIMGDNPSHFKGDDLPVENVSWNDCQEFVQKLNAKTGQKFRLPTEAEWEFAARGGNRSHDLPLSGSNSADDVAWFCDNSDVKTHPVGLKSSNEIGLYDMSGNVWEWCQNLDNSNEQPCVLRGGSWYNSPSFCSVSKRYERNADYSGNGSGFRLVLDL